MFATRNNTPQSPNNMREDVSGRGLPTAGSADGKPGPAKTRQDDRRADARRILESCAENAVIPDEELTTQLLDGFGQTPAGEDPFDAVVGLLGMIDTVRCRPEPELPGDPLAS